MFRNIVEQHPAAKMGTYTASKSKTGSRPGWSVTFRHPCLNDTRG
jgi:hypothetical protein